MSFFSAQWFRLLNPTSDDQATPPILDCPNCRRLMTIKSVRSSLMHRNAVVDYFCPNCGTVEMLTPDYERRQRKSEGGNR